MREGTEPRRPVATGQLHLHRLHLCDEPTGVIAEERRNHAEHGIPEAADVQNVRPIRRLRRGVRLEVDALQIRSAAFGSWPSETPVGVEPTWNRVAAGRLAVKLQRQIRGQRSEVGGQTRSYFVPFCRRVFHTFCA